MRRILIIIFCISGFNVFAANVIPRCTDISSISSSRIYNNYSNNGLVFYTNGLAQKFFSLSLGECISGEEPGVYKSVLVLKQDGNLVNYVYDEQNDITHVAFASDTASAGATSTAFYLDSNTSLGSHSPMIELLDKEFLVVNRISPLASKYSDKILKGSVVLSSIIYPNLVYGLTMYDGANGGLYNYAYNAHPVNYVDVYFDRHTLETRDAQYLVTIHDSQNSGTPVVVSCQFPFTSGNCYGKVNYVESNHYVVYLEDFMTVEIAKLLKNGKSKRAIYFDRLDSIDFSWNDTDQYIIPFTSTSPLSNQKTYSWTPSPDNYSTLHMLSWDDNPTVPDGDYKENCDMDGTFNLSETQAVTFNSGILSGTCFYVDTFGIHYVYSSLDYDLQCKKDPTENDLVTTHKGVLTCQ